MIVVTGATGAVGGMIARQLADWGERVRMIVRDPERAPDVPGAEVAGATYDDQDALAAALEPGDRVFMVSMHSPLEERIALHRSFVEVATRRRVDRIAYLSFVGADSNATFVHGRSHGATEEMLRDSGVCFAAVRTSMYSDTIGSWFDTEGRITGPGGDGRASFSYRPEIAEATAALLADPAHDWREIVAITGPEAVGMAELAGIASEVTGHAYSYAPLGREEWIASRRELGRPDWAIEAGITYWDGVSHGEADVVSGDYEELTAKAPVPIGELIDRFRADMPLT